MKRPGMALHISASFSLWRSNIRRARSRSAAYQNALMLNTCTPMPSLSMSATRAASTGKPRFPSSCRRAGASNCVPLTMSSTAGTAQCACTSTVAMRRPPTVISRRLGVLAACAKACLIPQPTQTTPADAATAYFKNPLRLIMAAGIFSLPEALPNTRRVHANFIDARPRCDIKSLAVGVAEFDIGSKLRRRNRAQMFALRRNNPDPAGRRFVEIPFAIDSQAVGDAWRRVFADVDEHHAVRERAVSLDLITLDELVAAAIGIEILFVRVEGEPVRVWDIVNDQAHLAVPEHVNAAVIQLLPGIFFPEAQAAKTVGEVDRSILFNNNVVGAAEALSFVASGEDGALTVLFDAIDRPACPCRADESVLSVQRKPVRPDHGKLLEQRIVSILPIRLHESHAPNVLSGIAAVVQIDGHLAVGRPLVDHVGGHIAKQQIPALTFVNPESSLGKSKAAFHQFQLGVGRDECIERRIQSDDGFVTGLLRCCQADSHGHDEQDDDSYRPFFHGEASLKPTVPDERRFERHRNGAGLALAKAARSVCWRPTWALSAAILLRCVVL